MSATIEQIHMLYSMKGDVRTENFISQSLRVACGAVKSTRDFSHGGLRTYVSSPCPTTEDISLNVSRLQPPKHHQKGIYFLFAIATAEGKEPNSHRLSILQSVRRHDHPRHTLLPGQHPRRPRHVHRRRIPLHRRQCQICYSRFCHCFLNART